MLAKASIKIFVLIFFCIFPSIILAETIRVASIEYPPYIYTVGEAENAQVEGIIPQILGIISTQSDLKFTVHIYDNWMEALHAVKEGEADAIVGYKTPLRQQYLVYAKNPLFEQRTALFVRKTSGIAYSGNLRSLNKYRIGLVQQMSYGLFVDNAVTNQVVKNIVYAETLEQLNRDLIAGKIDVIAASLFDELATLKRMGYRDQVKILNMEIDKVLTYIAFSSKDPRANQLSAQIDHSITVLKRNGSYQRLLSAQEKHYSEELNIHAALGLYWLLKIL